VQAPILPDLNGSFQFFAGCELHRCPGRDFDFLPSWNLVFESHLKGFEDKDFSSLKTVLKKGVKMISVYI
jgi:hypothetical protein